MTRGVVVLTTLVAVLMTGVLLTPASGSSAPDRPAAAAAGREAPIFVELDGPSAVDAYSRVRNEGGSPQSAVRAALDVRGLVEATVGRLLDVLRLGGTGPEVLFRTTNAVPGVALLADDESGSELATMPGVRSVSRIRPKELTNTSAVQLTRSLAAWQLSGRLGDGIRIGVIDNGVDYTHADFGGPGTVEAFEDIDPETLKDSGFPTAKVVGGFDFAGDDYDAGGENGSPDPQPDPNPLPCAEHGSHVAGTAAGFGVNADGSTFTGDYRTLDPAKLAAMRIGPGTAPRAELYAYKVFGCEGSTTLTAQALDAALDPNGDGDFADRLDVVNLSLGTDFGTADDPDAKFISKLADAGVVPVVSAGNGGDLFDVGSAPGSAPEALTVGSSKDGYVLRDGAEVIGAGPTGLQPGQYSLEYTGYSDLDMTRPVVTLASPGNTDGCDPWSESDAMRAAGKFVWLQWSDEAAKRRCGSAARADNATAAGAAGVLIPADAPQFSAEIAGNADVPMFQFAGPASRVLEQAVAAGGLQIRLAGALKLTVPTYDPALVDTVSEFSARGLRDPGAKPDVTAPGDSITSALFASGAGRTVLGGTSMAAPHVAGIAALVREQHPDWPVADLKAAVVNTAGASVRPHEQPDGPPHGPNRVGTGRVDALAAVATEVVAQGESPGGSIDFGRVDVTGPVEMHKRIRVQNKGSVAATYQVSYRPATEQPGVSYALSASKVTVPAGETREFTITMRIPDPAALRRVADPTLERKQDGFARQFVPDASGSVVLQPANTGEPDLRVAVYGAPRPVADLTTIPDLRLGPFADPATLTFGGRGLQQGEGSDGYRSRATVLTLAAESPRLPPCVGVLQRRCTPNESSEAGDIRYVGVGSTVQDGTSAADDGVVSFGFASWGTWNNLGSSIKPYVLIDTDTDGTPDFELSATKLENTDVLVAETKDLRDPEAPVVASMPLNGAYGDVDTNVYDTDVAVLSVPFAALGLSARGLTATFDYTAGIAGFYTAPADFTGVVDEVGTRRFDPLNPPLLVDGAAAPALGFFAVAGTELQVSRGPAARGREQKLLVIAHHNGPGERATVVPVRLFPTAASLPR